MPRLPRWHMGLPDGAARVGRSASAPRSKPPVLRDRPARLPRTLPKSYGAGAKAAALRRARQAAMFSRSMRALGVTISVSMVAKASPNTMALDS